MRGRLGRFDALVGRLYRGADSYLVFIQCHGGAPTADPFFPGGSNAMFLGAIRLGWEEWSACCCWLAGVPLRMSCLTVRLAR